MGKLMDCKEFERLIPGFMNQELDFKTLKIFQKHMETCDSCKEELSIQFLITEGMARLEEGNSFDFQKELDKCLEEAKRKIKFHNYFLYAGVTLEVISVTAILGVVLWIIL